MAGPTSRELRSAEMLIDRLRADGRRDPRHERRRARPVPHPGGRRGSAGSRRSPTISRGHARRSGTRSGGPTSSSRPAASGRRPDDLTREAIAAACGETPAVDPALEAWLRGLWARRGHAVPGDEPQAGVAHPVGDGAPERRTARPRAGGSTGPTAGHRRPARPAPRDAARCGTTGSCRACARAPGPATSPRHVPAGRDRRIAVVADILGEELPAGHRTRSSRPTPGRTRSTSGSRPAVCAATGRPPTCVERGRDADRPASSPTTSGPTGETTWAEAIGAALAERGWTLAALEVGTGGALAHLLGALPWPRLGARSRAETRRRRSPRRPPGARSGRASLGRRRAGRRPGTSARPATRPCQRRGRDARRDAPRVADGVPRRRAGPPPRGARRGGHPAPPSCVRPDRQPAPAAPARASLAAGGPGQARPGRG